MGWHELTVESEALRGNPLGDPASRPLFVCTPPGYDSEPDRRYPSIYLLHAMTSQARAWFNVAPFLPSFPEQLDALALEAVIVAVDGFTALGGAQWIDSPAIGDYGRYLCEDVVELVDAQFRTLREPVHRGVAGKSSGGFGAMVWSMLRPDLFGAFATHAGDALFEVMYAAELAAAAQALRNLYDSSPGGVLGRLSARAGPARGEPDGSRAPERMGRVGHAFSDNADGTVELPFPGSRPASSSPGC